VNGTIFAPTNVAFEKLFARGAKKAGYSLETFINRISAAKIENHIVPNTLPETGIQTSTGTIVKVDTVRVAETLRSQEAEGLLDKEDGAERFDQMYSIFRTLVKERAKGRGLMNRLYLGAVGDKEKVKLAEIYYLGNDLNRFHTATGMIIDYMYEMRALGEKMSPPPAAEFTIINQILATEKLHETTETIYADSSLRALVPRDPGNAKIVFEEFFLRDGRLIPNERDHMYGFNSVEETKGCVQEILNDRKVRFENQETEFDMYYLAYQMVVSHSKNRANEDNLVELIKSGVDGEFRKAVKFMKSTIDDFVGKKSIMSTSKTIMPKQPFNPEMPANWGQPVKP
jgi:hypothetical protein